jgi:hypothetical protein
MKDRILFAILNVAVDVFEANLYANRIKKLLAEGRLEEAKALLKAWQEVKG